ncbi:hypothetical protein [Rhizobium sp. LEGMi135b]
MSEARAARPKSTTSVVGTDFLDRSQKPLLASNCSFFRIDSGHASMAGTLVCLLFMKLATLMP